MVRYSKHAQVKGLAVRLFQHLQNINHRLNEQYSLIKLLEYNDLRL